MNAPPETTHPSTPVQRIENGATDLRIIRNLADLAEEIACEMSENGMRFAASRDYICALNWAIVKLLERVSGDFERIAATLTDSERGAAEKYWWKRADDVAHP
jgi:hypothetical protein